MLSLVLLRITDKVQSLSLNRMYENIVKLEWLAIVGLIAWLVIIFTAILH
jgi:hypothetical protein